MEVCYLPRQFGIVNITKNIFKASKETCLFLVASYRIPKQQLIDLSVSYYWILRTSRNEHLFIEFLRNNLVGMISGIMPNMVHCPYIRGEISLFNTTRIATPSFRGVF